MAQFFEIHPDNPQRRLIQQAVAIIDRGGLIIYPTDSSYALGCHIGDKAAMERIQRIRRTDKHHHFTLVCSDLSEIGTYAKVSNSDYRLMKTLTPGPYTFLLQATSSVASDLGGAAPPDESEAQNHRRARSRQQNRTRHATRTRSADHEQYPDPTRQRRSAG